jgi:Kef-type K+ transport system membrane component KefB
MLDLTALIPDVLAHVPVPFDDWRGLPPETQKLTPIADCAKQTGAAAKECAASAPKPEGIDPRETIAYVLGALALILIAARLVGELFVRVGQPRVVGEIIAGVLIGPTVLGGHLGRGDITSTPGSEAIVGHGLTNDLYPVQSFAFLNLIGQVTLIFFMFLVGMEVEQRFLRGRYRQIVVVAVAVVVVPVALGFVVAGILSGSEWKPAAISDTTYALVLGAALAVTAFPVMARILQEKRMLATDMGAVGVGAAALVTPLMFLVLAGAAASAEDASGAPRQVAVKLALAAALAVFLFAVVRPMLRRYVLRDFDPEQPLSGTIFAVLIIGALATGLAADRIGINSLNGGFLFGACVPQLAGIARAVLARMADFVIIFLIPIFLAVAGLQTDFRVLTWALVPGVLLFLFAMVAGKWFVGAGAGMAVGLKWRDANTIGVLMSCRGLMILVVAIAAGSFGGITPEMRVVFALGAIVTTIMTGPLVDLFVSDDEVERERTKSIHASLPAMPAMTGGRRVVVAPDDPARMAEVLAVARSRFLAGDADPPPQFLLVKPREPDDYGDHLAGVVDEAVVEGRALAWLRTGADALTEAGATAETATFASPDAAADLARTAEEWAATDAIAATDRDADALAGAGIAVHRPGDARAGVSVA